MSRRKQARPIRLLEEEENAAAAAAAAAAIAAGAVPADSVLPAITNTSEVAVSDTFVPAVPDALCKVLMCQRCQEQFTELQEYLTHKSECDKKALKHGDTAHSDPEDMVVSENDEDDDDEDEKERLAKGFEFMRRHKQDAANNNSVNETTTDENPDDVAIPSPAAPGHVTLEALQNTKVAVAQFAATAMANNPDNESALQELAVLQSTLFTLQHQQVLQLQLINQLQQQLQIDRTKEDGRPDSPTPPVQNERENHPCAESLQTTPTKIVSREPSPVSVPTPASQPETQHPMSASAAPEVINVSSSSNQPLNINNPLCSISSSLASTIITHSNDPPSFEEPNTLEMLQKRAQEVLDNASQGLLATNLADELAFRKSKGSMSPYDSKGRNEPFFKHRCRYCGKVFGSDSALQIHIRSHTGERPYKCNVCGSRFTTKGNLKVHFQRHSQKFPHIKMNPNPVPEHLDKYHPPLLAQLGQQPSLSPGGPPHPSLGFGSPPFPPTSSLSLYRPPILPPPELMNHRLQPPLTPPQRLFPPHPMFIKRDEQEVPADLRKPQKSPPLEPQRSIKTESEDVQKRDHSPDRLDRLQITPKEEPNQETEHEQEPERFNTPQNFDDCSNDSKFSNEERTHQQSPENRSEHNMQDEPENLCNRSNSLTLPLSISTAQRIPANFSFRQTTSPPSSTSSGSLGNFPISSLPDITKDPAIYTNLLPRPGSNDNSWESLIEITKSSETSKLQQLVDNIEHKLSDPNQCVICNRVLSCKSALQMHYRTHTGERPFRCKICGRAFTTKGNLKTHMGVHRAKPPMRVLHQCPVCHKKFTNALVLQQHIRLHTGEPTDLTPEQIQAAEVKDFPHGGFPGLPNSMHSFLSQGFHIPGLSPLGNPNFAFNMKFDGRSEHESMDDDDMDDDDDMLSNSENQNIPPFMQSPTDSHNHHINQNSNSELPTDLRQEFKSEVRHVELDGSTEDLSTTERNTSTPHHFQNGDKSPTARSGELTSPESAEVQSPANRMSTPVQNLPSSQRAASSPTPSENNSMGALDLTPKQPSYPSRPNTTSPGLSPGPAPVPSLFSAFGILPPQANQPPLMTSALSSLTSSVLTSTAFSPLRLAVGPPGGLGRGNTTCNLCFKTFACHSALEIHYRSHTKERPFKCTVCDRGFSTKNFTCDCSKPRRIQEDPANPKSTSSSSTGSNYWKSPNWTLPSHNIPSVFPLPMTPGYASTWMQFAGNMKQHMLTHKIRDMPQHMFDKSSSAMSSEDSTSLPPTLPPTLPPNLPLREQSNDSEPPVPPPPPVSTPSSHNSHIAAMQNQINEQQQQIHQQQQQQHTEHQIKRESTETELPLPKRPPSLQSSKHLCHVCNKNFSSSSALQIHMRTHTGDKPFRCTVCQKAFTTKGNLKVHMGTHMWSNGASRRGRRMSLDLPPIPMTPKDSEFLQRRPDLFYPYLPAPFLNGMQQKLNEISSMGPTQNGLTPAAKFGPLSFGYPAPPDGTLPQASSPDRLSDRPPSEPNDVKGALWDLHFQRKNVVPDAPRDELMPATREGLAA